MVPTVDTIRYDFLVSTLIKQGFPVLICGPVGTGKTSIAQSVLDKLGNECNALTVNLSSQVYTFLINNLIKTFFLQFHN